MDAVSVNSMFYRGEPHMMQRYLALALDNIARDPAAFALASAYRAVAAVHHPRQRRPQHRAAVPLAAPRLRAPAPCCRPPTSLVFLAGVCDRWRRRSALLLFLVPIVYVPLTICFVLTNMRYTVTMQPLMFAFVAVAVLAALGLTRRRARKRLTRERSRSSG